MKKMIVAAVVTLGLVTMTACSGNSSDAQSKGQDLTEQAFGQQQDAVPYPADELDHSLERQNIRKKLLLEEDENKIGYVYIMSFGRFIGYYTVKGKVSSNQSQMTTDQLIAGRCWHGNCDQYVVNAPGDDGSYGGNEDGIFFFTTNDVYVSTNMDYVYLDQPMQVDVPELVK